MMSNFGSDFLQCKDCAFYYLNKRRYTKKELIEKLINKDYSPDIANDVADYLEEAKYIDDADYARRFIMDAVRIKKYGIVRIKNDLMSKGVNLTVIDEVINNLEIDTDSVLESLIETKSRNIDLDDEKQLNRLYGFLLRRGFKYGEIKDALNEYRNKKENF